MTRMPLAIVCALVMFAGITLRAQDMPDPALIHGRAIPAAELPDGTVTVRVVREAIGNDIPDQEVRVTAAGTTRTATTDTQGRAEFQGLPIGTEAVAEAVVDGETLVSQPFPVPSSGGLRVILVARIAEAAERREQEAAEALAAPPVRGVVVLGGETHVITEYQDDRLRVFYRLDIVNNARTRVDTGGPLIFDLPRGAAGAAQIGEALDFVTVSGTRVTILGPFNPGTTRVDIGFELQYSGADHTLTQTWPVTVQQWIVGVEQVGGIVVASPQLQTTEQRAGQDGSTYVVGTGPAMAAGSTLTLELSNLPSHPRTAPIAALALALGIIGFGAWLSISRRPGVPDDEAAARERREALLGKLAELEKARRAGKVAPEQYAARRERLVNQLEPIYRDLDVHGAAG